jgi:hypothetical protein
MAELADGHEDIVLVRYTDGTTIRMRCTRRASDDRYGRLAWREMDP